MHWLYQYILFLAQWLTVVVIIIVAIAFLMRQKLQLQGQKLIITDITAIYRKHQRALLTAVAEEEQTKNLLKLWHKTDKAKAKSIDKNADRATDKIIWLIDFQGDIKATGTKKLSEEISAILQVAKVQDEIVLRLESPGGLVNGYGLAAAELLRIRQAQLTLTICIDKVAASGGYLMACCGHRLLAAPFAVVGSIGVVAQIPNIHRLLKKNDVDVDVLTAGENKRKLTFLGENNEEGKQKFLQELQETHSLFKTFVLQNRPQLDLDKIANGDHWYGSDALQLQLIDEIQTSESYLLAQAKKAKILHLTIKTPLTLKQKILGQNSGLLKIMQRWLYRYLAH